MNQKSNGGPAFPTNDQQAAHAVASVAIEGITDAAERDRVYTAARAQAQQGMTLRDYFAAKALPEAMSRDSALYRMSPTPEHVAKLAYEVADAMLAERAK